MSNSPAFSLILDSERAPNEPPGQYAAARDNFLVPITIHSPRAVEASQQRATVLSSVISLTATTLGAGLLSLPKAVALLGVTWGIFAVVFIGCLSDLTLAWLVDCSRLSGRRSYEGNAGHYLGRFGAFSLHAFLILLLTGASIAMLVIAVDTVPFDPFDFGRTGLIITFSVLALPWCTSRRLSSLHHVSALSLVCLGYFYLLLMFRFSSVKVSRDDINWNNGPRSVQDAALSVSVILSSFICHFNIFKIDAELADLTTTRTSSVIHMSTLGISASVYVTAGLAGYLLFGATVSSNVLKDFENDFLVLLGKGAICLTNFFKFPLLMVPLRDSVMEAMPHPVRGPLAEFYPRLTLTVIIMCLVSLAAVNFEDLMSILGLVGSTAGVFTAFFLPAVMKLRLNRKKAEELTLIDDIRQSSLLTGESNMRDHPTWKADVIPMVVATSSFVVGLVASFYSFN